MQGARAEGDVGAHRRGAGNDDPGPPSAACGGTAAGPDARPPPRPVRAAAPRPVGLSDIVARDQHAPPGTPCYWPLAIGPGASSRMGSYFCASPWGATAGLPGPTAGPPRGIFE